MSYLSVPSDFHWPQTENPSSKDTETLSTGEKNGHFSLFWLDVNLSSFNKQVQQEDSIARWDIDGQNVLHSKYITMIMADSWSKQLSDNPLSIFIGVAAKAAFLDKILKIIAVNYVSTKNTHSFKQTRLLICVLSFSAFWDPMVLTWDGRRTELMFKVSKFTAYNLDLQYLHSPGTYANYYGQIYMLSL